jgi:hypothetical protein
MSKHNLTDVIKKQLKDQKRLDLVERCCQEIIHGCESKHSLSVVRKPILDHGTNENTVLGTEIDIFSSAHYVSRAMSAYFHYYPEYPLLTISVVSYPLPKLRIELYIRRKGLDENLKPDALHDEILKEGALQRDYPLLEIKKTYTTYFDEEEWSFILGTGEKLLLRETDNPLRALVHIILEKFLGR